jgi:hypothetical protein
MPRDRGKRGDGAKFLYGVLAGTALSTITYLLAWGSDGRGDRAMGAAIILLAVKAIAAFIAFFIPGMRTFAGGVLLSIAFGFLVFFGLCAANFKIH